jgi:hypothetical protein
MYLGLVFFTDISCHKTGSSLIPCASLFLLPFRTSSPVSFTLPELGSSHHWHVDICPNVAPRVVFRHVNRSQVSVARRWHLTSHRRLFQIASQGLLKRSRGTESNRYDIGTVRSVVRSAVTSQNSSWPYEAHRFRTNWITRTVSEKMSTFNLYERNRDIFYTVSELQRVTSPLMPKHLSMVLTHLNLNCFILRGQIKPLLPHTAVWWDLKIE